MKAGENELFFITHTDENQYFKNLKTSLYITQQAFKQNLTDQKILPFVFTNKYQ